MTMKLIEEAILYATMAHAGVTRKGKNTPYIFHPLEVMLIVSGLNEDEDEKKDLDEELLAAAVLHDTVEDTDITKADRKGTALFPVLMCFCHIPCYKRHNRRQRLFLARYR